MAIGFPRTLLLRLPACAPSLTRGRDAVRGALRADGWCGEPAERIVLALSEALANAIEHGSPAGAAVEVQVSASAHRVLVSVTDAGRSDSATPVGPRPIAPPSSPHGRGLAIMRALADAMEVRPLGAGTRVRLEFVRTRVANLAA
jgi:anti-sigma regulatory factor (Ser/Thr protein kinase)